MFKTLITLFSQYIYLSNYAASYKYIQFNLRKGGKGRGSGKGGREIIKKKRES